MDQKKTLAALWAAIPPDDPDAAPLLGFMRHERVRVLARPLAQHIGAIWLPGRVIVFNAQVWRPGQAVTPEAASLFLHELCHLRQGIATALSVYGELEAWQAGFRYLYDQLGKPYPPILAELMALPLVKERKVLQRARFLMQAYASKAYRADLLPLFPWGDELRWQLWERWR